VTQAFPSLIAIVLGGRLAESRGRKPVAAGSMLVLAVATAGFFLWGGPELWLAMLVATVAGAMSGPAITAFNTELFPTEVRGRASAALLGAGVAGSASGLLLVGYLADPLGDVGKAVAVTCIVPVIVALLLIPRLPEGRGRALDELSPPEV
jgi:MFS family permease